MEALGTNLHIISALCVWILSVYGYGLLWGRLLPHHLFQTPLFVAIIGLLGVISLSIAIGILNFFLPISPLLALSVCSGGLVLFFAKIRAHIRGQKLPFLPFIYGLLLALSVSSWIACVGENVYDTGLYHIQALKWIQESPVVFGIANIHTRLGFNNILYNFAALTEVSNLFPLLRSFISNEIIIFFALFASFSAMFQAQLRSLHLCFVGLGWIWVGASIFHLFGLYAEGILGIFGYVIIGYILFIYEQTRLCQTSESEQNKHFMILFILAFFSVYIKISGIFLILSVIVAFVHSYGFSRQSIQRLALMLGIATLCGVAWAIKGICLSGAVAYPAGLFYFEFLPWAVDNATRSGEVLGIHHWAKVGGAENPKELLESGEWIGYWLKTFLFINPYKPGLLLASIGTLSFFCLLGFKSSREMLKQYAWILITLFLGIVFWFFSAPDPRFGWQYFAPFFGFFISLVVWQIGSKSKAIIHATPLFSLFFAGMIAFHLFAYSPAFESTIKSKSIEGFTHTQKIPSYPIQKLTSHYGVEFYAPTQRSEDKVYDAPLPSASYPNLQLAKSSFLGRDMYFVIKDSQPHAQTTTQEQAQ